MGCCCSSERMIYVYELDPEAQAGQSRHQENERVRRETYAVLFDYKRRGLRDLDLKKGDHVTMLRFNKSDWSLVRHDGSQGEGYVPSNYIVPFTDIEDKPWYYGRMSPGNAADALMSGPALDGMFLVRESSSSTARHTLSTVYKGSVTHYRIEGKDGKYIVEGKEFPNVEEMIEFYRTHLLGSPGHRLSVPCQLKSPETADLQLIDSLRVFEVDRDRLQFQKIIGKGNFSEVWRGTLDALPVAIKTVNSDAMDSEAFIREAEIMCRLHHPNLVALRGVGTKTRPFFIVSELMPKGDLLQYLKTNKASLIYPKLVNFAYRIAEGMKYLERENFIHRDLAARNILVGQEEMVKIADFGLARLIDDHRSPISYIIPVRWTAPEAYFDRKYSLKSDVWSYGVLLFEIFSLGDVPYADIQNNADVMNRIKNGHRMTRPTQASEFIYELMRATWNDAPESRPSFATIVERIQDDHKSVTTEAHLVSE